MSTLKVVTHYLGLELSTSSQTLHYWKLIGETWFYRLARCQCTSAGGQESCSAPWLGTGRMGNFKVASILHFGWQADGSLELRGKKLRKSTLFLPIPWFRGVYGKSCRSSGWSKGLAWPGESPPLLQTRGHMTGRGSCQVSMLVGHFKFYFKKKLKLVQINSSQRCLFCFAGWDRLKAELSSVGWNPAQLFQGLVPLWVIDLLSALIQP